MGDLERELRELSAWLETPEPPDVTADVRVRLGTPAPRRWRSLVAAALVALLVAVVPPARAAVADAVTGLLRFAGVSIATSPATSPAPARPGGSASPLPGQRAVALDEARRAVRFPVRLPARLGPPERVLVADPDATGRCRVATLLYDGGGLRIDAFDGRLNLAFHKEVIPPGAEWVQVEGDFGVWVDRPHVLSYVDRAGEVREETARLAASTLIWQDADVSYRLEGSLSKAEAVEIARSLR